MRNLTKKITETAQTANFSDFPLVFDGNGPKSTKIILTQIFFLGVEVFLRYPGYAIGKLTSRAF